MIERNLRRAERKGKLLRRAGVYAERTPAIKELVGDRSPRAHRQAEVLTRTKATDTCLWKTKETNETRATGKWLSWDRKEETPHHNVRCLQTRQDQPRRTGMAGGASEAQNGWAVLGPHGIQIHQGAPFQFSWPPSFPVTVLPRKRPSGYDLSSLVLWSLTQEFPRLSFSLCSPGQSEITSPPTLLTLLTLPRRVFCQ